MNIKSEIINAMLALLMAAGAYTVTAAPALRVGDLAPKLQTGKWMQGDPVEKLSPGKAYLIEFWATWCGPCRVSIPHVNQFHNQFKDKGLIVIGQDCWERDESLVAPFIKTMGDKMTYRIALDDKTGSDKGKMAENWMAAAGRNGIPSAFLVDTKGRVAWIGHPMELTGQLIEDVLAGKFDVQAAAAKALQEETANQELRQASELARNGKLAEAEQPLNRLLDGAADAPGQTVQVLAFRASMRARNGRFKQAADDLMRAIESDPTDHWNWYVLAPLLVESGNITEYQARCKAALERFGNTTDAMISERVAKICLLLPAAVGPDDLTLAGKLAGNGLTLGQGSPWFHWFQFTKGLADYRQGHFADAIEGMRLAQKQSVQSRDAARDMCEADTYFVSALAHHQLRQADDAHAALEQGLKIVKTKLPKLDEGDLGDSWYDILPSYILMREAKDTVDGMPASPKSAN